MEQEKAPMKRSLAVLLLAFAVGSLHAAPASPANAPLPPADIKARLKSMKPGEYLWYPEVSPQGPVTIVVSLTEQKAYIYRNGIAIGVSTLSSGKKGRETPTGVFSILQKSVDHKSDLYNSAPMPYMQRLTWDGIALHAGNLPGYPASHGCIRLPMAFAKKLYGITGFSSTTVIISNASSAPKEVDHPGLLAPTVADGRPVTLPVEPGEIAWNDPGAERGPLSVLISRADQRAYVYRGGQRIGTAPVQLPARPQTGMAVFSLLEKPTLDEIGETSPNLRWSVVQVSNPGQGLTPSEQLGKIRMDPTFVREMLSAMDVGSPLVITDWASTRDTHSDSDFTVIATETPNNPTKSLKK